MGTRKKVSQVLWIAKFGFFIILAVISMHLTVSSVAAATYYVKPDGSDANNGMSWSSAFQTIQHAIDAAAPSYDSIWVKGGTYLVSSAIMVNKSVDIFGGFAGFENDLAQRRLRRYPTVIDGQNSTRVFIIPAGDYNAILDGFAIINGNAVSAGDFINSGGGIVNASLSPVKVRNCDFKNNTANNGGAVSNHYASEATIINCIFQNNSAGTYGGGVFNFYSLNVSIYFSNFIVNVAGNGGGVANVQVEESTIGNSIFWNNTGGGTGNNDVFIVNTISTYIGYCNIEPLASTSYLTLENNINYDPQFVDATNGNFHLDDYSELKSAGVAIEGIDSDFEGDPRPWPTATPPDIGADEYLPDTDGDGVKDDIDEFPTDPVEWVDSDSDGVGDNADPCPDDSGNLDNDSDGICDNSALNATVLAIPHVSSFGGPSSGNAVAVDSADNIISVGQVVNAPAQTDWDFLIGKYAADLNLSLQWLTREDFGGANDYARGVAVDSQDNIIARGFTGNAFTTIKFAPGGTRLQIGTNSEISEISPPIPPFLGGAVAVDSQDNIIAIQDLALIKYNSSGTEQWTFSGFLAGGDLLYMRDVAVDSADNILITGRFERGGTGGQQFYATAKIDGQNGVLVWLTIEQWSGSTGGAVLGYSVDSDPDGNVITAGRAPDYSFLLIKYDAGGNIIWKKFLPAFSEAHGVAVDSNGNIFAAGTLGPNSVTLRYLPDGTLTWKGVSNDTVFWDIAVDSMNNIAITGEANGNDFLTVKYLFDTVDTDSDGLSDADEINIGTDPNNPDTDGDSLSDGAEVNQYTTDPLNFDTDNDTYDDGVELAAGTDPELFGSIPLEMVDDFYDNSIDTTKWISNEFVREIKDSELHLSLTQKGTAASNWLTITNPEAVNTIQTKVKISRIERINAYPRARIGGYVYNDTYSASESGNGAVGNIFVQLALGNPTGSLRAQFIVSRCDDATCQGGQDLINIDAGLNIEVDKYYTLSLSFDPTNISWSITDGTIAQSGQFNAEQIIPQIGPAKSPLKGLGVRISGIGSPNDGGTVEAYFDDVYINNVLYDDFSPPPDGLINPDNWSSHEFVRIEKDHRFVSAITRRGINGDNHQVFYKPHTVTGYQADVTVTNYENSLRFQLQG